MTKKKEILEKINNYKTIINKSKKELLILEEYLFNKENNWKEKFKIWWNNSDNCEHDWIPDSKKFPLLRQRLVDLNRYEKIDLREYLEEEVYFIFYPEELTEEELIEDEKQYKDLLLEIMNGKLKIFTCDW